MSDEKSYCPALSPNSTWLRKNSGNEIELKTTNKTYRVTIVEVLEEE